MKRSNIKDSELTYINCPICNAVKCKLLYEENEFPVWKCLRCSHIYVSPQPSKAVVFEYYDKHLPEVDNQDASESHRQNVYNQTAIAINKYMQHQGDLLDIGAGFGGFLERASVDGWRIHGLEINRSRYNICKQRLSSKANENAIQCSSFEDAELDQASFDAIVLINVIEHVKNPVSIFERAYELLRPGGCIVIRWPQLAFRGSLHVAPEHLHGFTGRSISTLINKTGFINVQEYWAGIGDYKKKNNLTKTLIANIFNLCGRISIACTFGRLQIPFVARLTIGRKP
jgi:2-polyprenyl-3-methyl-5-hydroxy-6-metoxy-1,4-benzoquinol methylase